MSLPTLYAPRIGRVRPGDEIELPDSERSHLRALRLAPGDRVQVTDGRGRCWEAELRGPEASGGRCALLRQAAAAPDLDVALAFGVGAKDRTLWLVEKAVELGVRGLQPLELARSHSVADAGRSSSFWEKAERRAVAALKQCGGARLPTIAPVRTLDEWLAAGAPAAGLDGAAAPGLAGAGTAGLDAGLRPERVAESETATELPDGVLLRLVAALDAPRTLLDLADARGLERGALLLVGPEGGLAPEEEARCRRAGFEPVALGPRTLRFETAAVAGLALLAQHDHRRRVALREPEAKR